MLAISEALFLLALLEKKETYRLSSSLSLPFSLAGAVLMELTFSGHVRLEGGRIIPLSGADQVDDELQKQVLDLLLKEGKHKKSEYWVYLLRSRGSRLVKGIAHALFEKGILFENGKHYRGTVLEIDQTRQLFLAKYQLKCQLRDAVFCDDQPDEHLISILSLVETCGMADHIFTRDEITPARKRVKALKDAETLDPAYLAVVNTMTFSIEKAIAAAISA